MKIDRDRIINIFHIEKMGGVTLRGLFVPQYKTHEIFDIARSRDFDQRRNDLKSMSTDKRDRIRLVIGHQFFGLHELFDRPMVYLTMLRHPTSRILSCYNSYQRKPGSPLHEYANKMSLREMIEQGIKLHFDNGMVRVLCGLGPGSCQPKYGAVTEEHYHQALENVLVRCYCGTTERYDDTLLHWYDLVGGRYPLYSRANTGQYKRKLDERTIAVIRKYNKWDFKLFSQAAHHFETKIDEEFDARVRKFQRLNGMLHPALAYRRIGRKMVRPLRKKREQEVADRNHLLFVDGQYQG